MYIIFDTETTGLPRNWNAPISDTDNWPRCVQLAWQLHDAYGKLIVAKDYLISPQGFDIPFDAEKIHGISTELALQNGAPMLQVLNEFSLDAAKAKFLVGQNLAFDLNILGCEFFRLSLSNPLEKKAVLDTCTEKSAELCQIPGGRGGKFKLPTLSELHQFLFQVSFEEAHNATADVEATSRCFFELIRTHHFSVDELQADAQYLEQFKITNPLPFQAVGLKHTNLKLASQQLKDAQLDSTVDIIPQKADIHVLVGVSFSHLHNHTQFSILQSTIDIKSLVKAAIANNMPAVALTDMGNMMAAFQFEQVVASENAKISQKRKEAEEKGEVFTQNELLPIIGCEFNVCQDRSDKTNKDNGYQIVFLAKNKNGYHNLAKLASIAYTDGFYYVPRIDKKDVEKYKADVIVLSGNLYGEIPNLLLNVGEQQAEDALVWWKSQFQDDFYLEVMRHQQENEDWVNAILLKFAAKHQVKLVATNNTFYIQKEEANSQDVLLCIKDAELLNTPKGRGRGFRFGLENEEYYFKSTAEMKQLFADLPEAIINTNEIVAKCEPYTLSRDILLPAFDIPEEFQDVEDAKDGGKRGENNFLRHITYEGAKERYGTLTPEITERIDFELETIANTGYPGYFLIVHDFCKAAREMDVLVGPGRGSAAGSVVAYCCGITNIDPLKYDLLFERFLNPERVSMPDIDIDFEDEGRGKVMEYVINKYGANQVAQIITYGTMAAKSSIRDAARVLDLPLYEADRIAKLVPDISLEKIFTLKDDELHKKLGKEEDFNRARELQQIAKGKDLAADVVNEARRIEGTIRNTGIHACGVIITPDDITNFVPVATAKDSDMWCTQFDNTVVETAGLLKMDFLGLKTLTILKDAVKNIQKSKNITVDIEKIPIDDPATYALFQRGDTVGIFQYESPGMQKYLRELKPTVFADLIAMNALYRPGPIEYIPSFIKRKNGFEEITYDLEASEEYLKETYGITVYQEQVMLLSQKLANFSKGEADVLRKAMGKKKLDVLEKMKPKFIQQASNLNGHAPEKLEKIWRDWEAFASYAFNKSHSTCYAWIAYQTAYLKANYPAEYMASVLSNNMNDIKSVGMFMSESKCMEIEVLGPDVNESEFKFTVNKSGAIRFGLGAIKGLGSNPINNIIENRTSEKGPFTSIFDLSSRVNLRICNKKAFESMALAGCYDSLGITRAQCFAESASSGKPFLETIMKYGASIQEASNSSQFSMFGDVEMEAMPVPELPKVEAWSSIVRLNKEKEVIGIFISGHPLDDYALEMKCYCNMDFATFSNPESIKPASIKMAGIVSLAEHRISKRGNQFGLFELEDFSGTARFYIDGENYFKYKHLLVSGLTLFVTGNISKSKFNPNEQRFNISTVELLEHLKNKEGKNLCISIETALVNNELIGSLDALFKNHPGKCGIQFTMNDTLTNVVLQLTSRNVAVSLDPNLLKELTKLSLDFKLIEN
jgi:DNA polymerase-3 subunit alpha